MSNRWVFELDVDPPEIAPARAVDFAGRTVAAFTTTALFDYPAWGAGVHAGLVAHAQSSRCGQEWILHCSPNANWARGVPFTADLLARLLRPSREASAGQGARFLAREVESVRAYGASAVRLLLKRRIPFLPEILSSDVFIEATNGPYTLAGRRGGAMLALVKNALGERLYPQAPAELFFVVTRTPDDGLRLFEQGVLDVTCNPNLPGPAWQRYAASPQLRTGALAMAGVLMPRYAPHTAALSASIRRSALCEAVGEGVKPLHNLIDIFAEDASQATVPLLEQGLQAPNPGDTLTLAYADFTPNGEVARCIADDLTRTLGVRVLLSPLAYHAYLAELREQQCDLIYTLIQPTFPEPVSFVEQLMRWRRGVSGLGLSLLDSLPDSVLQSGYAGRVAACRAVLADAAGEIPVIPVLRHTSKCLVSPAAQTLRLFPDGLLRPCFNTQEPPCLHY